MQAVIEQLRSAGVDLWQEDSELYLRGEEKLSIELKRLLRDNVRLLAAQLERQATPAEERAKSILGLSLRANGDNRLPMRVEQMWRVEHRRDGAAPRIPFDLHEYRLFTGCPDAGALRDIILSIVQRHEALRSVLTMAGHRPVLEAALPGAVPVSLVELPPGTIRALPDTLSFLSRYPVPAIDLRRQVGCRFRIFHDGSDNIVLDGSVHRYLCDHWSWKLLIREIGRGMDALRRGEAWAPADPEVQYGGYAWQQRESLAWRLEKVLTYWQGKLQSVSPAPLPYDHVRGRHEMQSMFFSIDAGLSKQADGLARQLDVSMLVPLLAAYQLSLAGWSRSDTVINAIGVADRFERKLADTIGCLTVALPVVARLHKRMSFADFIVALSAQLSSAMAHKELSYELYDELFAPDQPFCTTMFNFVPALKSSPGFAPGAGHPPDQISSGVFKRPLHHREMVFQLTEGADGLSGRIFFNTDFFREGSVRVFVERFRAVLEEMTATPSNYLLQIP